MTLHLGRERFTTVERVERIARNALLGGYGRVVRERHVHMELAMDCLEPYGFTIHGRYSAKHGKRVRPITVTAESRCRKCASCTLRRKMFWTGRAITEYQQASRTLFGTFTMSPEQHYLLDMRASLGFRHGKADPRYAVDFAKLSPAEIFTERTRQFGFELQNYLKLLRKGNPEHVKPAVRYLLIAEMHNSATTSDEMRGRPHFHILLHEQQGRSALVNGNPVEAVLNGRDGEYEMRRVKTRLGWQRLAFVADDAWLRTTWTLGFTKFQWCHSANSAVYVCKYLTKALAVRVRASQAYGLREQAEQPQSKNDVKQETNSQREEMIPRNKVHFSAQRSEHDKGAQQSEQPIPSGSDDWTESEEL